MPNKPKPEPVSPTTEDALFTAILPFISPMANHRDVKAAIGKVLKTTEPKAQADS